MQKRKSSLPKFLKPYFWDVKIFQLDLKKRRHFIIERLLEYGDQRAINWLANHYSRKTIKQVLKKSGHLSERSANFWRLVFNLSKKEIRCFSDPFLQERRKFWKY